jgi:hypothetical protein
MPNRKLTDESEMKKPKKQYQMSDEEREIRRKRMIEIRKKLDKVTKKGDTIMENAKIVKTSNLGPKKPRKTKPTIQDEEEEKEEKEPINETESEEEIQNEEIETLKNEVAELKHKEKPKKNKKPILNSSTEEENDSEDDDLEQQPIRKMKKSKPIPIKKPTVRKVFKIKYYDKPTPEELLQDRLFLENQHKDDNDYKFKKNMNKNMKTAKQDDLSDKIFNY